LIDISKSDNQVREFSNWATFSVSNLGLAKDLVSVFKDKSLNNLVLQAHGVRDPKTSRTSIRSDDLRSEEITMSDISSFSKNGYIFERLSQENSVSFLREILGKVKNDGNCVLGICNLGNPETLKDAANAMTLLSGNRLNLYFVNGWSTAPYDGRRLLQPDGSLTAFIENAKYNVQGYWTPVSKNGVIGKPIKYIIIRDSSNPIEFK
ncbi:MAG: hypothetical protein U5N85_05410, partial [Arcicella sp.]|nr:hypothetical protein [Arcicella sp.]